MQTRWRGSRNPKILRPSLMNVPLQIITVNSKPLEGLTHQEAVNILKSCEGNVTLQILS